MTVDLEETEFEYALFGKAEFIVGEAPVQEIAPGTEGLSPWAAPEINEAVEQGLVTQHILSQFPKNITREEFCELAVLLYEKLTGKKAEGEFKVTVLDADQISPWALSAVKFMNVNGIINGTPAANGAVYFLPKSNTTREMAISLVLRAFQTFSKF